MSVSLAMTHPDGRRAEIIGSVHIDGGSRVEVYLADGTLDFSFHIRLRPAAYAAALNLGGWQDAT